ncbi:hypothetical protein L1887_45185 [Cichorium endivia]|nr:hypothetical protein L1887_45185 [Cichorium endivia]
MGDAASHIIFDNVMLYMMFFYTDIFGIPAGFVGTMFLLARALDAISDPCMGLIADRTRSRWGKFRPWILFGAIPFGIVCVLAYTTPDLSLNGKMVYAAITYTLLTLLYTVVNIPYCALGGVITNDPTQRISLQSWRFVLATAGGMLSTVLMMPLVNLIGGDDKAFGFQGGQHLLVDQRRAGGGQRGDVLRPDARHRADVRLYLRHRRAAPTGDADPVGDDVRYRRLRRMDQRQAPDRHQLCGYAVRAEAWPGAGRGDDRLDAGRRRLRRGSQNSEQRDHQHHYRPVHPGPGGLLRTERHYRQTLLHAENPLPDQNPGRAGAERAPQSARI